MFITVVAYNKENYKYFLRQFFGLVDELYEPSILNKIRYYEQKSVIDHKRRTTQEYRNHHKCVRYIKDAVYPEFEDLVVHAPSVEDKSGSRSDFFDIDDDDKENDEEIEEESDLNQESDPNQPKFCKKTVFGDLTVPSNWKPHTFFFAAKIIPQEKEEKDKMFQHFEEMLHNCYSSIIRFNPENITAVAYFKDKNRKEIMHANFCDFDNFTKAKVDNTNYLEVCRLNPPSLVHNEEFHPPLFEQVPANKDVSQPKVSKKLKFGIKLSHKLSFLSVIVQLITFRPGLRQLFNSFIEYQRPGFQPAYTELLRLINRDFSVNEDVTLLYQCYSYRKRYYQADPMDAFKSLLEKIADEYGEIMSIFYFISEFWVNDRFIDVPACSETQLAYSPNKILNWLFVDVSQQSFSLPSFLWKNDNNETLAESQLVAIITENEKHYYILIYDDSNMDWKFHCDTKLTVIRREEVLSLLREGRFHSPRYLIYEKI